MDQLPRRNPGEALKGETRVSVQVDSVDRHYEEIRQILEDDDLGLQSLPGVWRDGE